MLTATALVSDILSGALPASAAIGRPDVYEELNYGQDGPLAFLGSSYKVAKGLKYGVLSAVLYMQPADSSGREACSGRSDGCTAACLELETGHMSMPGSKRARRRRHASFYSDRPRFLADLAREIGKLQRKADRKGMTLSIRLNGTTDLPWHRMRVTVNGVTYPNLHTLYPRAEFYEYTKLPFALQAKRGIPANLHLTFSISERTDSDTFAAEYLQAGYGAAVVTFDPKHQGPNTYRVAGMSWPTVDGDKHDYVD